MLAHPQQLLTSVCRIACGDEHGSGFFISPTELLTAWHVIEDHILQKAEIKLQINVEGQKDYLSLTAVVTDFDDDLDIALLEITSDKTIESHLQISLDHIRYNEEWCTFGYPFANLAVGMQVSGVVHTIMPHMPYDISLATSDIDSKIDYAGISGSPLVIFGSVMGVVTWSTIRGLGAVSIKKALSFLIKNNLPYENKLQGDWSKEFQEEIDGIVSNDRVVNELNQKLKFGGKYYLLQGAPGSGKSVLAATLLFEDPKVKVLGRYIVRLPGDDIPIYIKASKENFMLWVEDLLCKLLTGEPVEKGSVNLNERILRLSHWLKQVNEQVSKNEELGVIIVDGLDELTVLGRDTVAEFLGFLPEVLPADIAVLLSCTSSDILPAYITSRLGVNQRIDVKPLRGAITNLFLSKENRRLSLGLSLTEQTLIAEKSEGHPLYLKYLIQNIKLNGAEQLESLILALPNIDGDIRNYYDALWLTQISMDADKFWITLIASLLREPVSFDDFKGMLPPSAKYQIPIKFQQIRHLFKSGERVSIYHKSFEDFIISKADNNVKEGHQYISDFNASNTFSTYACKNSIHHQLLSKNPEQAILLCDQDWADRCALIHMEPDSLIEDIRRVEALCIDRGEVVHLFRIKFLLQRLRFRYNNVLAKHASEIARSLIRMGNPQNALKYILRGDLLLAYPDDAIKLLRDLYECNAYDEAATLYKALEFRFRAAVDRANLGEEISFDTFITHIQAIVLSANVRPHGQVSLQILRVSEALQRIANDETTTVEEKQTISKIREYGMAWHLAYFLYRFDYYASLVQASEISDDIYEQGTGRYLATVASLYKDLCSTSIQARPKSGNYEKLVLDIEELITKVGFADGDIEILLSVLLKDSSNVAMIEELIKQSRRVDKPKFRIRKANGVDANLEGMLSLFHARSCDGYVDVTNSYPILGKRFTSSWEGYLTSTFEYLGFIIGKVHRCKTNGRLEAVATLEQKVRQLVIQLNFSLVERVMWDRSYAIVEALMPLLYERLANFYLDFQPTAAGWFVETIVTLSSGQLGQYSEGYRRSLALITAAFAKQPNQRQNTFKLLEILEAHTDLAVQNRWERTPELLRIIELYATIKSDAKSRYVYSKMLDTSMGPTWYKEDQFTVINSSLRSMKDIDQSKYYVDFAAYLEFASGEMTFQRYVHTEINGFTGTLASNGELSKAIEYFKFQLLPSASNILANAESSMVDSPVMGHGYFLGAGNLIEPSAMLELLEAIDANPLVMLALSEIFLINSDTERYLGRFADVQLKAYMCARKVSIEMSIEVVERIVETAMSERLQDYRLNYLQHILTSFGDDTELLREKLLGAGLNNAEIPSSATQGQNEVNKELESEASDLDRFTLHFPGIGMTSNFRKIGDAIASATQEFAQANFEKGRLILADCLKLLQSGGSDVWLGEHLTKELGTLFDALASSGSPIEVLVSLKELIVEHETDDWRVALLLIKLLADKLAHPDKLKVLETVRQHIDYMIRSNNLYCDKYKWLESKSVFVSVDIELIQFLLWQINHPYKSIQNVVYNSTQWLAEKLPESVLPILVEHSLSDNLNGSAEFSARIIACMSKSEGAVTWGILERIASLEHQLMSISHISVAIYWKDALEACSTVSSNAAAFSDRYAIFFPNEPPAGTDVYLDEAKLKPVEKIIDRLNNIKVLNRQFCEKLMSEVDRLCAPLTAEDHAKVEKYIARSFSYEDIETGHYTSLLRSAICNALVGHIGIKHIAEVKEILDIQTI